MYIYKGLKCNFITWCVYFSIYNIDFDIGFYLEKLSKQKYNLLFYVFTTK